MHLITDRLMRSARVWIPALVLFVSCPFSTWLTPPDITAPVPTPAALSGSLSVQMDYSGEFYTEVFNYAPNAPNIAHYVLVMPKSAASRIRPGEIFNNLNFPASPGEIALREDRSDLAWATAYLYPAPQGYFRGEFPPGEYGVAVAFIAAAVGRENQPPDVILYPGITGGGASTEFEYITIHEGEKLALEYHLTDMNGWACPWVYVFNGHAFERRTEILRNIRSKQQETTEVTDLGWIQPVDNAVILRVAEEKDEHSYLDSVYLLVDGLPVYAEGTSDQLAATDQNYLVLAKGGMVDLHFPLPEGIADSETVHVQIVASGYYIPDEAKQ